MEATSVNTVEDVCDVIDNIKNVQHEWQLALLLKKCVSVLGAESFVYTSFLGDHDHPEHENHRYLIGCQPAWCQMYNARKWFMNDPFVTYAKSNSAPILGSQIIASTDGQREMLAAAAIHGFRSGIVIPSHSGNINHMGMLYIGSDAEPCDGETLMSRNRIYYRALASELLDWWIARVRIEATEAFKLEEIELQVLRLGKDGYAAKEMASELKISLPTMYAHYRRIKSKLSVDNIHEAVRIASRSGLLNQVVA